MPKLTRARRGADARASVPPLLGPAVKLQLEGAGQAPMAKGLAAAPPPPSSHLDCCEGEGGGWLVVRHSKLLLPHKLRAPSPLRTHPPYR